MASQRRHSCAQKRPTPNQVSVPPLESFHFNQKRPLDGSLRHLASGLPRYLQPHRRKYVLPSSPTSSTVHNIHRHTTHLRRVRVSRNYDYASLDVDDRCWDSRALASKLATLDGSSLELYILARILEYAMAPNDATTLDGSRRNPRPLARWSSWDGLRSFYCFRVIPRVLGVCAPRTTGPPCHAVLHLTSSRYTS